jgi:GT2 family glycosyltransferase
VVVSYADPAATQTAVASLLEQSHPPLEVLVVDNHPRAPPTGEPVAGDDRVRLVHSGVNLGYTAACNLAAARARGEWLFLLNPDARADPGCLQELLMAVDADTAVIGAQVLLPDGRVNAGDNPLHLTGISWAGRYGEAREFGLVRKVASVSGAALLARADAFAALGGLCERFFLYQDDADLCWRARLSGWTVRFCPDAVVWHDYEFDKGPDKWYWLERNRLWSVFANYSRLSLCLLAPMLAGAELAIAALALRDGWGAEWLRAWGSTLRSLHELSHWRRRVQSGRREPDSRVIALMTARFDSELLGGALVRRCGPLLSVYGAVVRAILRRSGS